MNDEIERKTIAERLRTARIKAGYQNATDAAHAMGIVESTYLGHDNGSRGIKKNAARYAAFYRISLDWLLRGKGDMRGKSFNIIPVTGLVGAGASVEVIGDDTTWGAPFDVEMPADGHLAALQVRGDSQYPRYLDGEYILYDTRPADTRKLIGQYSVVETYDGRRPVKTLVKENGENKWTLQSHNAPPERNVALLAAYRVVGTLAGK